MSFEDLFDYSKWLTVCKLIRKAHNHALNSFSSDLTSIY